MPSPLLSAQAIRKTYGATVALDEVNLLVQAGEIHALLGENGAGKSTLVKILSGVVGLDRGSLFLNGQQYSPKNITEAREQGISTAFQELSLLPNLTVAQNLFLPTLKKNRVGLATHRANEARALEVLERFRLSSIRPDVPVGNLSLAEKQRLEIVRALSHDPRLLVLDEPTAALPDPSWLFELLFEPVKKGLAVLYISHRLHEIRAICKRGTILRNGRSVDTVDLSGVSNADIFQMMVGRAISQHQARRMQAPKDSPVVCSVDGLTSSRLKGVSFSIHKGEVVGVAGLEGQGQRHLFRTLVGLERAVSGTIKLDGQPVTFHSPREALRAGAGMVLVPEERKVDGLFAGLSTLSNVTVSSVESLQRWGWIDAKREKALALRYSSSVELNPEYFPFSVRNLSGGNQQKAILARAFMAKAGLLLLFDPTRGVDVGTKEVIYEAVERFAAEGGSVLMYSSELPEILRLCDRCLVLYGGRVCSELFGEDVTEEMMVAAMTGHGHGVNINTSEVKTSE